MSDPTPLREHFLRLAHQMQANDAAPSPEEVDRKVARGARQERLERAKPSITPEDSRAIVNDRLEATHALWLVKNWVGRAFGADPEGRRGLPRFLVLCGDRGRGKTVACAWAIANEIGKYLTVSELRRLRTSYNHGDLDELRYAYAARLLVLDDLGWERDDDISVESLLDVLNHRQHGGYTLITSNLTEAQIRRRYGDPACDRIAHRGGFVVVRGDNLRGVG